VIVTVACHVGFVERVRQEHGVPVFIGEADAALRRGEVPKPAAVRDRMRFASDGQVPGLWTHQRGLRSTPIMSHQPREERDAGQ
jgi:hypothetical protein